jgi:hypothetical protein
MYNCNFVPEDRTDNLLPLTKDMVLKKKPFDKRGKTIRKGKEKTCVTIESNRRSQKKGCQCVFIIKRYIFSLQFQRYATTRRGTTMLHEVFAMGTSSRGTKLHLLHMFPQPQRTLYSTICDWGFLFHK